MAGSRPLLCGIGPDNAEYSYRSRSKVLLRQAGAGARRVALDEALELAEQRAAELVALDDALGELAAIDPRKSQIVELRFFGGLSIEETAEVLKISSATVQREWRAARAWLQRTLSDEETAENF